MNQSNHSRRVVSLLEVIHGAVSDGDKDRALPLINTAWHEARAIRSDVLAEIQDRKGEWADQSTATDPQDFLLLMGNFWQAAQDALAVEDPEDYRRRLIQMAAIAVAAVESHDRRHHDTV